MFSVQCYHLLQSVNHFFRFFLADDGQLLVGVPKVKVIRNDRREGKNAMQPTIFTSKLVVCETLSKLLFLPNSYSFFFFFNLYQKKFIHVVRKV